ncbi:TPP-dependent acetoin dehydrogenase complex, E2 component, dihydrolipoyllysine-residue acetyltransferase [Peptoniphilus sp. ING2-D1G]|nr:TPP-dependent acetoin dehydrogenase complex, E2 component, dihydrolipoyllysine-residue acetyltransferase [Peptoniphilus sp. ING2-D1G]
MGNFIVMPKMGLTMKEGNISNWRKKEGEEIKKGEVIFDVETDKLTNEFESTISGILRKIIVSEGSAPVMAPVAIVSDTADEDISDLLKQAGGEKQEQITEKPKEAAEEKEADKPIKARVKASPKARKTAMELGVDINLIEGTGPSNSITVDDVKRYKQDIKQEKKASPTAKVIADKLGVDINDIEKDSRIMKKDVLDYKKTLELEKYAEPKEERKKMTNMRKIIGKRILESKNISPSVSYNIKVDVSALKKYREDVKDIVKVSYNDILVKILSKLLIDFPLLNASIEEDQIITRNYVNMGVAVALPEGLIVPVVKYANKKGLKEISQEIKELSKKARNNELSPDDLKGGTFTISNIGMYGVDSFTPIINQPELAILGVNAVKDEVVVENGNIVIKPMLNLSLTADHRAIDGAVAAEFLSTLKKYIENPALMLL